MEKIINKLINDFTEGVDTYTHNGSTWLIFTESKQWVIELTDAKTLWYNYNFFKGIFSYTSMDVVDNQQYITKWVEDNIINKELTYVTLFRDARDRKQQFEDTIENGVIKTKGFKMRTDWSIEDTIENGVKRTYIGGGVREVSVDDTIEKGVKNTNYWGDKRILSVDDTLENGVKETNHVDVMKFFDNKMDDTLENGVKETSHRQFLKTYDVKDTIQDGTEHDHWVLDGCDDPVDVVLENGVKETHDDVYHHKGRIDGVIKNGVKETKTPGDGDLVSTFQWMEENDTNSIPKMIDDVIENGVKKTLKVENGTFTSIGFDGQCENVIENGILKTKDMDEWVNTPRIVSYVIENGVKETKVCNYIYPEMSSLHVKRPYEIDDVIENGEKINGTYAGGQRQSEKCKSVVEYGIKETINWSDSIDNCIDKVINEGTKNPTD